jgi:hypothetical protein
MDWICWVVPVKTGQTDTARRYCEALETTRRADYEASERELGIEREVFFLWHGPDGADYIVLYMDGDDMTNALDLWEEHTGEFETWGKGQWAEFCDSEELPKPLSAGPGNGPVLEVLSAYDATIHKTGKV